MTVAQVRASGRKALVGKRPMTRVGRAVEKGETQGFMKVVVDADGNLTGAGYINWLSGLAPRLASLLTPTGSIVIESGNAWVPGKPLMSTLTL